MHITPKKDAAWWLEFAKATGAIIVLLSPWLVWVTASVWAANYHVSREDAVDIRLKEICDEHKRDMGAIRTELRELDNRVDNMPPDIWKQKILALELDMKSNAADHARIITSLELIKQKLGVPDAPVAVTQ